MPPKLGLNVKIKSNMTVWFSSLDLIQFFISGLTTEYLILESLVHVRAVFPSLKFTRSPLNPEKVVFHYRHGDATLRREGTG